MNFTRLKYFVYAAGHGSYSDASKLLFVTRQAVAKAVIGLEKDLKVKLFESYGSHLTLTEEGSLVFAKASEIVCCCEDLESYTASFSSDTFDEATLYGSFSLAVSASPYEGNIIPDSVFEDFSAKYPQISLTYKDCSSDSGLNMLFDGRVDGAIILGRCKKEGYRCTKLFNSSLQIAVSSSHPLSGRDTVSICDMKNYPIAEPYDYRCCSPAVRKHLDTRGYTMQFAKAPLTPQACGNFLENEMGIVFVPEDTRLEEINMDITFLKLKSIDQIVIPVCLIHSISENAQIASLLQCFLYKNAKTLCKC